MGANLDIAAADDEATRILLARDLDPAKKHGARLIAERTPGIIGVFITNDPDLPGDAALRAHTKKSWYIATKPKLTVARARFAVLHEVAEFESAKFEAPNIEDYCNAVAAALAMPREAFLKAIQEHGDNPHRLAALFDVTPTAAELRVGEVLQVSLAVVTPSWMWTRGKRRKWKSAAALRREAERKIIRPGLRKIDLEPGRFTLRAVSSRL